MKVFDKNVTDMNALFKLIKSNSVVMVDFYSSYCNPCRMLSRMFDELIEEYNSFDIFFVKVNVDECVDVSEKLDILSVPTVMVFSNGMEIKRIVGLHPKSMYESVINQIINCNDNV